jgi:uncharacterized membrane protein HdeD (DUF308 family)
MPALISGSFLVLHGLITAMIGLTSATSPSSSAISLPAWFNWWPGPFGRSWVVDAFHLGSGVAVFGGLLWLVAGIALVGAGLGVAGVAPLRDHWPMLALAGGIAGLVAVAAYFHPLYAAAALIDLVLVAVAWSARGAALQP